MQKAYKPALPIRTQNGLGGALQNIERACFAAMLWQYIFYDKDAIGVEFNILRRPMSTTLRLICQEFYFRRQVAPEQL